MSINLSDNYSMSWKPDLSRTPGPKYLALVNLMEEDIKNGTLKAGTKLPSQKELVGYPNVNLGIISGAFKLCSQKGLLSASVGNGTYVCADVSAGTIPLCGRENPWMIEMGALVPQVPGNRLVKIYTKWLLKRLDALNLFSYDDPEGTGRQREASVAWLQKPGLFTDKDRVLLTAGGQNALTVALGALLERGDKLGMDSLTYSGVKTAAKLLGIHLISIRNHDYKMTEEGIRYVVQNEKIKGIYVIPDYHNPTSYIMPLETGKRIAELTREKHILVIENGINNLLTENPLPPIASFAPEQVIYLSSLSKTIAAGLRIAPVHVPGQYHRCLATTLYSMSISTSPLLAAVSVGLITDGTADETIRGRKEELRRCNHIISQSLKGFASDCPPTSPMRHLYLPDYFTGKGFKICAKQAGVQVYGAERLLVGNKPAKKVARIFVMTPPSMGDLEEGIRRLRGILG